MDNFFYDNGGKLKKWAKFVFVLGVIIAIALVFVGFVNIMRSCSDDLWTHEQIFARILGWSLFGGGVLFFICVSFVSRMIYGIGDTEEIVNRSLNNMSSQNAAADVPDSYDPYLEAEIKKYEEKYKNNEITAEELDAIIKNLS